MCRCRLGQRRVSRHNRGLTIYSQEIFQMKKRTLLASVALAALLAACGKTEPAASSAPAAAPAPAPAAARQAGGRPGRQLPAHGLPRREEDELVGFDVDMARAAAQRAEAWKSEFKPIDWSAKEAELSRQARRCPVERPDHYRGAQAEHRLHRALHGKPPDHRGAGQFRRSRPRLTWPARWSAPRKAPAPWTPSRRKKPFSIPSRS